MKKLLLTLLLIPTHGYSQCWKSTPTAMFDVSIGKFENGFSYGEVRESISIEKSDKFYITPSYLFVTDFNGKYQTYPRLGLTYVKPKFRLTAGMEYSAKEYPKQRFSYFTESENWGVQPFVNLYVPIITLKRESYGRQMGCNFIEGFVGYNNLGISGGLNIRINHNI